MNLNLLDHIVDFLGINQVQYQAKNNSGILDTRSSTDISLKTERPIPLSNFLLDLGVTEENLENFYIFKVNTSHSLFHCLLCLLDANYMTYSWERREYLIGIFKSKLYRDLDHNSSLINQLKNKGLRRVQIQKDIQERLPTDLLKTFMSVYFDINLLVVTCDSEMQSYPEVNRTKPSLLVYQFPGGNLAPIVQSDLASQILTYSKSPLLHSLKCFSASSVAKTLVEPVKKIVAEVKVVEPVVKPVAKKDKVVKTDKEKELGKLKLDELRFLATKHKISTTKVGKTKVVNLTKKELICELIEKIFVD